MFYGVTSENIFNTVGKSYLLITITKAVINQIIFENKKNLNYIVLIKQQQRINTTILSPA